MKEGYEEFKLKVLHKVTNMYLKQQDHPPVFCFQGEKGNNKLLVLPPEIFANKDYKEFLPKIFSDILVKTGSQYFCFIIQCTVTQIDLKNSEHKLLETALGRQILKKFKKYNEKALSEPDFTKEEHHLLCEILGEDRVVFMFQCKNGTDSIMSFTREEGGKLKPSLSFDQDTGSPLEGVFGNLFK